MSRFRPRDDAPETLAALPLGRLRLARGALLWEQLWPALWPATAIAGLFLVVALFDLLPLLPGWAHLILLIGLAGAFAATLHGAWRRLRLPDLVAARRRLERESGLAHRPLTALGDRLSGGSGDAETAALWAVHQQRLRAQLKRLRVGWPRAGLARRDPLALRAALGLLLAVGLVVAWGDGWQRVSRAVWPDLHSFGADLPVTLAVWITPPAYTGLAPIFLDPAAKPAAPLAVPEGSTLLAQVQGGRGKPALRIGDARTGFDEIEAGTYRASAELHRGDALVIEQNGRAIGEWPIAILPDHAPTVAFASPPGRTERAALRLDYKAADDYGLAGVKAVIRRTDDAGKSAKPVELALPLPGVNLKAATATSYHDLTPHPWAGLPVELRLEARDARGQTGTSEPMAVVLPEREFKNPVARAIIAERKKLTIAPNDRLPVAGALTRIGSDPAAFGGDPVVVLALRVAARQLLAERRDTTVADVQSLLWDTALRIEDGGVSMAERDLRAAEQALQNALNNGASDQEIERLMNQLQQALDQFLNALAEQAQKQMAEGGQQIQRPDPNAMALKRDDLQKMLDRMRDMARSGSRDAARDMLAQLQDMLENLRAQPLAGQPSQGAEQAMQTLRDLDKLQKAQQQLLERSFRQSQAAQPGDQGAPQGAPQNGPDGQDGENGQSGQSGEAGQNGDAQDQEALRKALGNIMRRMGEMTGDIPQPLGRAERAMRDATQALRRGAPGEAMDPQSRALSALQQGANAMAQALMKQFGQQPGEGEGQQRFGQRRDPLGRDQPGIGAMDTGDVKIPDKSDLQRAREILDELRRRAGERSRPKPEREYIDRLLQQF